MNEKPNIKNNNKGCLKLCFYIALFIIVVNIVISFEQLKDNAIVSLLISVALCYIIGRLIKKIMNKTCTAKQENDNHNNDNMTETILPKEETTISGNTNLNQIEEQQCPKEDSHAEKTEFSPKEIDMIIDKIARKNANYTGDYFSVSSEANYDSLFEEVAQLVVLNQSSSTALIQRRFSIGYNRTSRIMDQLERANIVGPSCGSKPREILCHSKTELEAKLKVLFYVTSEMESLFSETHKSEIEKRTQFYFCLIQSEKRERERAKIEEEKEKIKKQLLEKQRRAELKKKAMDELREAGLIANVKKREPIPQDVQNAVWRRDGGKCVKCGSQEKLEFDHIIPFSKGGSNTVRNLQLLCEKCNREKSNSIG